MYSLSYIVVAALVSHAPISALKEFALRNTDRVVVVVVVVVVTVVNNVQQ